MSLQLALVASNLLQSSSFRRRFEAAKARAMDLSKCTTPAMKELLVNYGSAVGCPPDYFLPLLTTCASFMGTNSRVQINDSWSEPAILWTLVVARKGEKKSAVLKPLLLVSTILVSLVVPIMLIMNFRCSQCR